MSSRDPAAQDLRFPDSSQGSAVYLLGALFRGAPAPAAPFPDCGADATEDALGCEAYEVCRFAFTFFGQSFAADGVFFVVDRSGGMQDSGELQRSREELQTFMDGAPRESRFGILLVDDGLVEFPSNGMAAEATPASKDEASTFIQSFPGGVGSCVEAGLLAALGFAEFSGAQRNVIMYIGTGAGTCRGFDEEYYLNRTLDAVAGANGGVARIHSIGVHEVTPLGDRFLTNLASRNGGTYTRVR